MCLSFGDSLIFFFFFNVLFSCGCVIEKTGQNLFVVVLRLSPSAIKRTSIAKLGAK